MPIGSDTPGESETAVVEQNGNPHPGVSRLHFKAEVKKAEGYTRASLDREMRLTLVTDDRRVADLAKINGDELVDVIIVYHTPRFAEP